MRVCTECGATVFADAPQGVCSVCLFRTGLPSLGNREDEAFEPTIARLLKDFGDYEVLEEIGRGGQGVVYRARQKSLNRMVALKVIGLAHWATEAHVKRFRLEAEAAARLNHPCIVPIYEVGERDGACYFSMGLVEGGQLDAVAKRESMPIRQAAELIAKLARTVFYAHEHGILHRDIKPGNILLDAQGEPHLTDFGLARLVETDGSVTRTLEVLGTPSYMAPEQAVGNNARVSSATDIYGLGAVLYQLLTGHPPFAGGTTYETVRLVLDTEPRQPRLWNRKIDRDLATICLKCLDKDPQRRYASALALAEDLERWLKHEPIRARRTGIFTRGRKWVRRNPTSALLAASLVALAAAIAALALALPSYWHRHLTTSSLPEKSIAVLPLENLSEEKENAFFADGVQEELLSNLAKIKDLKVISRNSVMQYKSGVRRNLKEIAKQLSVANVVEGSVRRSRDHVRVSVQLIDARTNRHLWGESYDRTLADSLALQGELATEIAAVVGATLSPQEQARVVAKPTNNPAAYDAYLRGRALVPGSWGYLHHEGDPDAAVRLFQEAVKLDPNFALAWAYLSIAELWSYWLGVDQTSAHLAAVKSSLDRALALDPNLPEVHLALGYYRRNAGDHARALAEFREAEKGLSNSAVLIGAIAGAQKGLGHWDEAIAELRRAIELDPRNVIASNNLALTYAELHRFPEALATLDRVLAWAPTNARALVIKAEVFLGMGDLQAAEPLLENPDMPPFLRARCALFQRRYAAAIEILSRALANPTDREIRNPMHIIDLALSLALSQQRAGNVSAARETCQKAVQDLQRQLEKVAPGSFHEVAMHDFLGLAYAGLGEAASAIAEGQKAIAMTSKDAEGADEEAMMANIYALLGDADHAIPILKRLLQATYSGGGWLLTPATLRLDPTWDLIRKDPRFQELAAENAPLPEKSIAVLPFQNLSKEEENAFFAGGVQDEILSNLAKVADLKVISRTSVMQYKSDLERNLREIARALGVSHVVEGSVQRAGERVRVSAQLIDARSDTHLWAEHYDRDVADVVAVQTEIAQQIADQLQAKLSPAEKAAIEERPTADPVAYAYYTQAKAIGDVDDWEGWEKSCKRTVELLEKATQRDPNFALAYCELAKTHGEVYLLVYDPKHLELAKKAAEAAVRVRPDLGETHLALARYYFNAGFSAVGWAPAGINAGNFDRARDELAIAQRKLPNNSEGFFIAGRLDRRQNRWDSALANLQKANDLDPRNSEVAYWFQQTYFYIRRYNEEEQLIKKCAASGTFESPWTQYWLAEIKLAQGDPMAAQSLLDEVPLDFSPMEGIWDIRFLAALYLRDYDAANRVIAATPAKWAVKVFGGQPPVSRADGEVARARGDKQKALTVFATARKKLEATWSDKPRDEEYFRQAAMLDAGLGRKDDAIREALRAVELMPITKDSIAGPALAANLALVYAWTGERDRALGQLEIVATLPGAAPTYGDLCFNPCWDSLRGDKRFDKIVAAAKAASR
jgi:TolB-like protein/Tfp pilus assembly protein PilF/predicted Ser/Thr protein kinase